MVSAPEVKLIVALLVSHFIRTTPEPPEPPLGGPEVPPAPFPPLPVLAPPGVPATFGAPEIPPAPPLDRVMAVPVIDEDIPLPAL